MAEYGVVIKEARRMCWHYTQSGHHDRCPMYPACNVSQCRKIAFERPADFEARVMDWATEHPEPIYPTWTEYFRMIGLFPAWSGHEILDHTPIPADTAKQLGVEPKEVQDGTNQS